jgi:hypothetical protein
MIRSMLRALAAFWLPFCATAGAVLTADAYVAAASAAEPVRHIAIYVQPYYEAARTPNAKPLVLIGKSFDGLLSSNRREDILSARDKIVAEPKRVTPMTMMVLAIRLYDVGLRDDAVFWFYAAKDRFFTLADVVDIPAANLSGVAIAVKDFATLVGPVINGYAFCDLAKQRELRAKAFAFVEQNPYEPIFMRQLPAKPGDRQDHLRRSLEGIKAGIAEERAHFENPTNVAEFVAARKKNEADAKYCWRS